MRPLFLTGASLAVLACAACATTAQELRDPPHPAPHMTATSTPSPSPLLAPWTGPHGGVPPFDRIRADEFPAALEASIEAYRRDLAAIADNPEPPTFENTLAAFEDAGRAYDNVGTLYGIWASSLNGPEFQPIERALAPRFAAVSDEIYQNEKLFRRIEAVYQSPDQAKRTPEQQRLAWHHYTRFVRSGARLDAGAKKRLVDINQRLASLFTQFGQNVLADEEGQVVWLTTEAELDGLPESVRAGAAAAAEARGQAGKWAVTNTRSSMEPFLTYSKRRELREKVWRNYVNRGDNGGAHDNNAIITEILQLRAERAKLLGYATHAHWRLENSMAGTPERALTLMEAVWTPAVARVREEVADMQAIANKESAKGAKLTIEPWDYRYYAEKVRKAKYDLDENEVKPYLQLEKLREGMFWVAGELFGFTFTPVTDVAVFHPDVRVWQVKDKASGAHVGLWYFDPYARPGKRSGAWMNAYRAQENFRGEVPTIVSNNSNFVKGKPGEPVLISWSDAQTLFHEFGHALHGLSSRVHYPGLSGTAVVRDYVEFPSQLLEHWLSTPEVLNTYALHAQTGKPIPAALIQKLEKAATFNQGFGTVEYLSSALIDMKLHLAGAQKIDPDAFERDTLKALGMPKEIVMRHRTPQFGHVFAGDGYSAGYYSYLWADTLTADAYEAFTEAKGPYDTSVAGRLKTHVFQVGNTVDPAEGYRAFRGKDAGIDALMRKRGFPVPGTKKN
ncbi:M3 family metallopeptidase [Archangium primigenium]|uniref:M3 family metallopeptidase n=1 Tax=[Archangium] primigenium TaxID=2792470 RepID=UPI00195DA31D|nr:M3 family metallopeptidase [Archangium primigenium]MBM7115481.1 M3 family metallopeptidase [Archangium primigenium]